MSPRVQALANLLRDKREQQGKKCVIMLGAGASLSSGVPATTTIMEGLLGRYGTDLTDGTVADRFDRLWARSSAATRDLFLEPYLKQPPSPGYLRLARLLADGYFDLVITFNFDRLLETALRGVGLKDGDDFQTIVRGDYRDDHGVRTALEMPGPRVKLLKMHGSLQGGDTFLFTRNEMHEYREEIKTLLGELTRRDVLVCGYAFADSCVERAFCRDAEAGNVFCVNPTGAPPGLAGIMSNRHSESWVFDGESGYFDTFFADLHSQLTASPAHIPPPKVNPFKFLISYDLGDKDSFHGREKLIQQLLARFQAPPKVLHLVGPPKVGKTSLVRAGLIASLNPERFLPVYLRCQGPLESWLPQAIGRVLPLPDGAAGTAIQHLAASTPKHVVVVLDQFERVVSRYPETEPGQRQLMRCLSHLADFAPANLSFLCVGVNEDSYVRALLDTKAESLSVRRLDARLVGGIISRLARKAGIQFDPQVIRAIMRRYDDTQRSARPFTLAHIQAVCNILASAAQINLARYEEVLLTEGQALDVALNVCDIISFVEDIPDELGRNFFRKIIKIVPVESKMMLANWLKDNFAELFPAELSAPAEASKAVAHA
ncbi:MAG: SIR2 family protein [Bryobacteraceae bacterium]|jgi:hypothetical protein